MLKWISAVLVILFGIVFTFILYLSTIGIETNSFNSFIQNKLKNYNQNIVLNFSKAKLLLDLKSLNLKVKLIEPKITAKSNEIIFDKVNSSISLRSYLKNEFAIKNIELKTHKIELNKFTKFMSLVNPSPFIFILNSSINKGTIEGETELFFNQKGKLIDNYEITGSISNLETKMIDAYKLEDINLNFKIKKDFFEFDIKDSKLFGLHFDTTKINIKKNSKDLDVLVVTNSVGKIDNIKELLNNFDYSLSDKNIDVSNLDFKLNHKINFKLKNLIKIKDLKIEGSGLIDKLLLTYDGIDKHKKYIEINKIIEFQNNQINYAYNNDKLKFKTSGKIKLNNKFEDYTSNVTHEYKNYLTIIDTDFDLDSLSINLENLNYYKPIDKKANLKINAVFDRNKKIIKNLKYNEFKNNIIIKNLYLNNKYQIYNFDEILINTLKNEIFNNDFSIYKKENTINVSGQKYDATYFFKTLNEDGKSKVFSKKFKGKINFKINEIISENEPLFDFAGIGQIKSGKLNKLTAKANFSDNTILEVSITPTNSNKKKLFIYSDKAKPFVSGFKFIKGFSEGKLEYISDYDNKISKSNLKIYDFKVKDVPALAKLLSLASLQGMADLLTGEGIRFSEFEIEFMSEGKLVTIDELYAIGPAISILMSGYVEKDKLVSLRGTLVPATTLNKIIGSLPLIGKILVGSKTGEGVFGVSFKIKGSPKKLKTTVNPIKTLTPRFITRTLEKIKKSN